MVNEYRRVIENVSLDYDEAQTLYDAECILKKALDNIFNSSCQYDKDLVEAINQGIDGLKVCNPRLNVNAIVEQNKRNK